MPDIPARADADERFAQDVQRLATGRDPAVALEERLDDIARSVRSNSRLFSFQELKVLPVLRLESLDRHWRFDAKRFERWRSDLHEASGQYNADATQLAQRSAEWQATLAANESAALPPALTNRIAAVQAQLALAEKALSAPLERQIQLGQRGNALEAQIKAGQEAVAAAIGYIDSRLVSIDAPPLWAATEDPRANQDSISAIRAGLEIEGRFLAEYGTSNVGARRALNALQLMLLPLLIWAAARSRRRARDQVVDESADGDGASAQVLRRPLATWLLLAMMGVLVFEPDAPLLLHQIVMLGALIPVLRLLPPRSYRVLGPWPYAAAGLYLLNRLGFMVVSNELLYRLYILGLTLLALAVTSWLLWRSRGARYSELGRVARVVRATAWLGIVILTTSAIASLAGNVSLAEMLTGGLIDSGYMGLVLYASVTVSVALLGLLLGNGALGQFGFTRRHGAAIFRGLTKLLRLAAVVGWAVYSMSLFRVFRPLYASARDVLTHAFAFGQVSVSLGNVLLFAIGVYLAFWIARTMRFLLAEEMLTNLELPRGVGNSVASLSYYALLLLGLLVALAAAGFQISQLAFVFGALGVGIGFGLQNVVNNFVSGLILMFERPIQPGDVVDISGTSGRVREIGMRATTIKTFEGADVVVPNGTLLSEKLTNWTLRDTQRRLDIAISVAYGSDPDQVIRLLRQITCSTEGVMDNPEPTVLFTGFGDSALEFRVCAWTHEFDTWLHVRSQLMTRLHAALGEAGIEIPFPQRDLHLRSISPEAGRLLHGTTPQDAARLTSGSSASSGSTTP